MGVCCSAMARALRARVFLCLVALEFVAAGTDVVNDLRGMTSVVDWEAIECERYMSLIVQKRLRIRLAETKKTKPRHTFFSFIIDYLIIRLKN